MSRISLVVLLTVCCCAAAGAALAADGQVYRWVDSSGVTHFSDRPPASGDQAVTVSPVPAVAPADARRQAELRAWVAQVNAQVDAAIQRDREYRLRRRAVAAWASAQTAAVQPPPEPDYAAVFLPYGGVRPFHPFRRSYHRHVRSHVHDHHRPAARYNTPARTFSAGWVSGPSMPVPSFGAVR